MEKNPTNKGELLAKYLLGACLVVLGGGVLMQAFGAPLSELFLVLEGALFIAGGLYVGFHKIGK